MSDDAVQIGAACLNISADLARSLSRVLDGDLTLVWTDVRGEGAVLVGPDGSALYLASSLSVDHGVTAYRAGTRTPRELFAVFDDVRPTRR